MKNWLYLLVIATLAMAITNVATDLNISWIWVLAPLWGPVALSLTLTFVLFMLMGVVGFMGLGLATLGAIAAIVAAAVGVNRDANRGR